MIEDSEGGTDVKFLFPGGFDATSGAHQLAHILQLKLDEMAAAGVLKAGELKELTETQGQLALVSR